MNCIEMGELMQRQLDNDLSTQEEIELEDHLLVCSECNNMYKHLSVLSTQLEQLPHVTPPFSIVDSILPELEKIDSAVESSLKNNEEAVSNTDKVPQHFNKKRWFIATVSVVTTAAAILLTINLPNNDQKSEDMAMEVASSITNQNDTSILREFVPENVDPDLVEVFNQSGGQLQPPSSTDTDLGASYHVSQLKIEVTNSEVVESNTDVKGDLSEEQAVESATHLGEGEVVFTGEVEDAILEGFNAPLTGFGIEDENPSFVSPHEKVYLKVEAHNIVVYDFNTDDMLKTIEVPIEGEVSIVGWHESGVEFYIDVVDSNMQTHRITYSLGL